MAKQYVKNDIKATLMEFLKVMPLKDITVRMIVEKCEINRNTFYYYYSDIYSVIYEIFDEESKKLNEYSQTCANVGEAIQPVIEFLFANKDQIRNLYYSAKHHYIDTYLYRSMGNTLHDYLTRINADIRAPKESVDLLADLYKAMITGLMIGWIEEGMKDSFRDELNQMIRLLEGSAATALKKQKQDAESAEANTAAE